MTPLPPKQGLKQFDFFHLSPPSYVMTPLPPKQGLKQYQDERKNSRHSGYDTTSTKTRIETHWDGKGTHSE